MAVPTLAAMAALTLLQHPEQQPEGVSVDYTPFRAPAILIQRMLRGVLARLRRRRRLMFDSNPNLMRLRRFALGFIMVYNPYRMGETNRRRERARQGIVDRWWLTGRLPGYSEYW